ncbi:GNAT family N-acetyltransferase [Streptomyces sp. NPDC059247]|uniref:GNAT family N-acetyltransferase n=1 Tax=Streptomyces sp. NPDC059247 TaxID=3346790 RepID=UPI003685CDE8
MKNESVTTARLLLDPLSVAEAERIVTRTAGDGDLWAEAYPGDGDVRSCTGFLRGVAERGDPGAFRPYAIRLRDGGETVGGIGFHGPPDALGVVTVGYGLVPGARGRGYASEALRGLVGVARRAGASGVKGDADLDNVASHRVMEAAGLLRVAETDGLSHHYLAL